MWFLHLVHLETSYGAEHTHSACSVSEEVAYPGTHHPVWLSFTLAALGLHLLKKAPPLYPCLILFSRELALKFP